MAELAQSWRFWALLSAGFAALTAILARIGDAEVDADVATLVRTVVILGLTACIVASAGQMQAVTQLPCRSLAFLVPSGLATGASRLCCSRARSATRPASRRSTSSAWCRWPC